MEGTEDRPAHPNVYCSPAGLNTFHLADQMPLAAAQAFRKSVNACIIRRETVTFFVFLREQCAVTKRSLNAI